jgi:hypothetical protein
VLAVVAALVEVVDGDIFLFLVVRLLVLLLRLVLVVVAVADVGPDFSLTAEAGLMVDWSRDATEIGPNL